MKLLFICGSRDYPYDLKIRSEIYKYQPDFVMNGAGGNADKASSTHARDMGIHAIEVPAVWDVGRRAGPARNAMMALLLSVFIAANWEVKAVAFSLNLEESPGTRDMVGRLKKIGLAPEVIGE